MICKKCGIAYEGDSCLQCAFKTTKQGKLLGFRTNKIWKKALSIIYMAMVVVYVLACIITTNSVNDIVKSLQEILFMIAPYIFLSNFKLRNRLPLFNKHKIGLSFLGIICVYFVITIFCVIINPATYCEHKWIEIEKVIATCTQEGQIKSHCDLCDSDNIEYITSKGHNFEIKEENEEKTVKICSVCNEEKIEKKEIKNETDSKSSKVEETVSEPSADNEQNSSTNISELGITKSNPIVLSIDEFVKDINADFTLAKEKYNGKYIKITGNVNQIVDGGIMTGYYIYGKRGESGLRVMCWVDGDKQKGVTESKTYTFLGIIREITTMNVTEIAECTIIQN